MNSILFISNYIVSELDLPIEIVPNYTLRLAEEEEIQTIKYYLKEAGINEGQILHNKIIETRTKEDETTDLQAQDDYSNQTNNFYLFSSPKEDPESNEIFKSAIFLSELSLRCDLLLTFFDFNGLGHKYDAFALQNYFYPNGYQFPTRGWHELNSQHLNKKNIFSENIRNEIQKIHKILIDIKDNSDYDFLKTSINTFYNTLSIKKNSQLEILSFFIAIEAILIKKPDPKDPTSSISRQISSKLNLINNQLIKKFEIDNILEEFKIDFIKFIKELYSIRSIIAHGEEVDYKNKFKKFTDQKSVKLIIEDITRKTLFYSLHNKELIKDLRAC